MAQLPHLPPGEAADQEVLTAALTPGGAAPHSGPAGTEPGEKEVLGDSQVNQQQT